MLNLKVRFSGEYRTLIVKTLLCTKLNFSYSTVCISLLELMYSGMCLAHGGYSINVE